MGESLVAFILALMVAASPADAKFCPAFPSPTGYSETRSQIISASGKLIRDNSVQVAMRLVNIKTKKNIGWLYLDEHGQSYVSLIAHVDRAIYRFYEMDTYNMYKPEFATEATLQRNLRLPSGIEIRSCSPQGPDF